MAIDPGGKRTGLAVGDDETRICAPAGVLSIARDRRGGDDLVDAIAQAADDALGPADAGELVVGLPLNMDGSEGAPALEARRLAARLAERTGRRVHCFDERLTSAAADDAFRDRARSGTRLTHAEKKARRDALAACFLLEAFLNRSE